MEIASVQECGCVIHELFAGIDDKFSSQPVNGPAWVWDPVRRKTMYIGPQQRYSAAAEAREEAEAAFRLWAKYPPEAGFPKPAGYEGDVGRKENGDPRGSKRRAKAGRKGGNRALDLWDTEAFDMGMFQREMERRKLSLAEFRAAIRAGGFKAVHLVAQGPFFLIQGEPQGKPAKTGQFVDDSTWLTLVTTRGRRNHMFLNPTVALAMLKELGVNSVQVDMESWRPDAPTDNDRRRPDMAKRLRFAHEYAREGDAR